MSDLRIVWHYIRTPINLLNEVKVNFDKSMNSLCFSNQPVFSISMQYRMHMLQTIRTNSYMVNCIVQFVNCMIYVIYMPHNFFMKASTILGKKFYMYIHSPSVFAFLNLMSTIFLKEFFRFLSQFVTQLCVVYLNKNENNN